jgi:GNAT superfamily N-acetyltransferase
MTQQEILALFDREQRQTFQPYKFRREVTPHLIRHISTAEDWGEGMVVFSQLTSDNADAVIRETIDYFTNLGQDFEWKLYNHDTPSDLKRRLQAVGFEIGDPEAVLVLDIHQAPPALLQPVSHDVRRISRPAQIEDVVRVQQAVWPDKAFAAWLEKALKDNLQGDSEHISIYVAYVENRPASSAWVTFQEGGQFAGLWGGSTLAEYRGRGLYTALVAARLQEARQRAIRFLTIDASPMSRPILEKYGFQLLTYTYPCQWRIEPPPPQA